MQLEALHREIRTQGKVSKSASSRLEPIEAEHDQLPREPTFEKQECQDRYIISRWGVAAKSPTQQLLHFRHRETAVSSQLSPQGPRTQTIKTT